MKILGIIDGKANRYHRVYLPLEGKADFLTMNGEPLKKEMFKGYDVIWMNFLIANQVEQISAWKQELGFKLVLDLDDSWWDFKHPMQFEAMYNLSVNVPKYAVLADIVSVSTLPLAEMAKLYNKNVVVIPNFLPVGNGQFVNKPENKKYNGKLRIGLFGGASHTKDWTIFKGVLNKLAKNKQIVENCEFKLLGVPENSHLGLEFKKKKNLNVQYFDFKPVENYMELLNEVDVVCQPLELAEYNICRSGLKVIECSIKDVLFIGSDLYEHKEFPNYFKAETPVEYEKTILELIDNYEKWRDDLCAKNLALNKWEERVNFTTEVCEKALTVKDIEIDAEIYSIKYLEEQSVEHIPYLNVNTEKPWRFEYSAFIDVHTKIKKDYVGMLSWKFPYKTSLFKKGLISLLEAKKYKEYDFVNLTKKHWATGKEFLEFSEKQHPGLLKLLKQVCDKVGLEYYNNPSVVSYSNFFICKKEVFQDYVQNYVIPALDYMENEAWEEYNQDAQYAGGLDSKKLKELTGMEFYNFPTFVLERMLLMYLEDKKLKTLELI